MLLSHSFCAFAWILNVIYCNGTPVDRSRSRFTYTNIQKHLITNFKIQSNHGNNAKYGAFMHNENESNQTLNTAFNKDTGTVSILVDLSSSQYYSDSKFLSLTIGSNEIRYRFKGFDFESRQLQSLAHGLSPCYLRLGGTPADFLTFDPDGSNEEGNVEIGASSSDYLKFDHLLDNLDEGMRNKTISNFTMPGKLWTSMTHFFKTVGWDLMFDFNLFKWRNGLWDPTNAELLLNYSDAMGYNIPAFQLGNEPNSFYHNFNFSIKAPVLVKDFEILKKTISSYPRYQNSQLFGPDVTNLNSHPSARNYLRGFLQAGGGKVVSEISLHHYYLNGRTARVEDFYNLKVLDSLKSEIEIGLNMSRKHPNPPSICFTETSSCYGGGAHGLSDAYVAGFLWLDKLGLSARYGVTKVFRQTFYRGSYSLISSHCQPLPDYFLSLLHKRLIVGPVFNVTLRPEHKMVRVYAHCTRMDFYNFPSGSITLAYLNIDETNHTVSFPQFQSKFFLYSLTPGDKDGLTSRFVKLNGRLLKMTDAHLPPLIPSVHRGDVTLLALTFGFIVFPSANASLCQEYHRAQKFN